MSSVINTNMPALNAQRNLSMSQSMLATSLQRLSSGLRINSAKDDAAGLSIASRMSAQIGGLNQAARNANDAISMSQTAEGAMSEVSNMLIRLRDLAVQSANGTNSSLDRATIQNEVDQLTSEIDRVSNSTEFNGNKLLNGKASNLTFQVGANAGQTIAFSINEVSVKSLALNASSALGDLNSGRVTTTAPNVTSSTVADLVINGVSITLAATDTTATLKATAINNSTGQTGVSATAYNSLQGTAGASGLTTGALTIAVGGAAAVTVRASADMQDLVDKINADVGGITASIGSNGGLSLTNDTGAAITIGGTVTGTGLTAGTYQGYLALHSNTGQPVTLSTLGVSASNLNKSGFNATASNGDVSSFGFLGAAAASDSAAVALLNAGAAQPKLLSTDDVKINGVSLGTTGSSAAEKAFATNAKSESTGVTATANTTAYVDLQNLGTAMTFTINGSTVTLAATDTDTAKVVTAIQNAGISGISASTDASTGRLVLSSSGGNDIVIGQYDATAAVSKVSDTVTGAGTTLAASQSIGMRGTITLHGTSGATVRVDGTAASIAKLGLSAQGGNAEAVGGKLNVSTASNASIAITRIDAAIQYIATQRSTMGAVQNRFSSAISNLTTSAENITSARSRIQDADFAAETATLTRAQILQQAGTAMLAQANALPNGVLALLR